jgi:hypothetical protein
MKNILTLLVVIIQIQSIFMDVEYLNSFHHGLNLDPSLLKDIGHENEKKGNFGNFVKLN